MNELEIHRVRFFTYPKLEALKQCLMNKVEPVHSLESARLENRSGDVSKVPDLPAKARTVSASPCIVSPFLLPGF